MTVFEQNTMERNAMNLERIADSLESIDAVLRKLLKAFENKNESSEEDKE